MIVSVSPVAAFRVVPYFACTTIALPPLDTLIDISSACLAQMENDTQQDPEEDDTEAHLVNPEHLDGD